jgi:hypothetical protein
MATKKKNVSDATVRGAALAKRAVAAGKEKGLLDGDEPVPTGVLKKLRLPNDEKISPAMKEVLAADSSWLGLSFDEDEPEFDALSLEDLVEQEFEEDAVPLFGEAYDMLGEDCILLGGEGDTRDVLYVGTPDDAGEYPVITLHLGEEPAASWVGGFLPFDVWAAVRLGALEAGPGRAAAPAGYEAAAQALAQENGDGRLSFEPKAGSASERDDDDEDDEDDEDEDDEDELRMTHREGLGRGGVFRPG